MSDLCQAYDAGTTRQPIQFADAPRCEGLALKHKSYCAFHLKQERALHEVHKWFAKQAKFSISDTLDAQIFIAESWTLASTGRKVETCLFYWDHQDEGHLQAYLHENSMRIEAREDFGYWNLIDTTEWKKKLDDRILTHNQGIDHWLGFIRDNQSIDYWLDFIREMKNLEKAPDERMKQMAQIQAALAGPSMKSTEMPSEKNSGNSSDSSESSEPGFDSDVEQHIEQSSKLDHNHENSHYNDGGHDGDDGAYSDGDSDGGYSSGGYWRESRD